MVTDVFVATGTVAAVKVAAVAPAGTVTLAGTVTATLFVVNVTTAPPAGAIPFSVTVPVELLPPSTLFGLIATDESDGGFTVRIVVRVVAPSVAEIVTEVAVVTADVVIVNVAVVAPAATVTDAGTFAAVLSSEMATLIPPAGAAADRVTVPVEFTPPITVAGDLETDCSVTAGGFTVKAAVRWLAELSLAVMVTIVGLATALTVTANVALVAPEATVTFAGTVAAALLDDSVRIAPPVGAAPLIVTVPVTVVGPTTDVWFSVSD